MLELKNPKVAVPVVLFAGILWSFGPLVVRYMDNPNQVPWQYIFGRGLTIFILLNLYLYFEEGIKFYKNYLKMGYSGIIGGTGLGNAMISFIYSITNTSAAITLLCLAAMPFFTALLAFLFLKEKITLNVWISIFIATVGIIIMAFGSTGSNSVVGFIFGILVFIFFVLISSKHLIGVIFKNKYFLNDFEICMLSAILISLWPFVPTGNFLNNWVAIVYYFPVGFLLWSLNKRDILT